MAVNEIGNSTAQENYEKNGVTAIFGRSPPHISSYDMMRIGQDARDELWMNGRNRRGEAQRIIEEYEESYCVDIHQFRMMKILKIKIDVAIMKSRRRDY